MRGDGVRTSSRAVRRTNAITDAQRPGKLRLPSTALPRHLDFDREAPKVQARTPGVTGRKRSVHDHSVFRDRHVAKHKARCSAHPRIGEHFRRVTSDFRDDTRHPRRRTGLSSDTLRRVTKQHHVAAAVAAERVPKECPRPNLVCRHGTQRKLLAAAVRAPNLATSNCISARPDRPDGGLRTGL